MKNSSMNSLERWFDVIKCDTDEKPDRRSESFDTGLERSAISGLEVFRNTPVITISWIADVAVIVA